MLSAAGLDPDSGGGGLDVMPCNQQGTPLHAYGQGVPKTEPTSQFLYYTVEMKFSQTLYYSSPKLTIPMYQFNLNSTTRNYPMTGVGPITSSYSDFDISSSGNYHPSRLLTTQMMGKDTFLTLLPTPSTSSSDRKFVGTLLSMSLYDRVVILPSHPIHPFHRPSQIKKLIKISMPGCRTPSQ
jgi:hypothetical protein